MLLFSHRSVECCHPIYLRSSRRPVSRIACEVPETEFCARGCPLVLKGFWSYENRLLFILGLSFGFAFFDRNAINYLAPFIKPDLGLNNTQIGMLGAALAVSWAVSAFIIGRWSDAVGVRKPFLVGILLFFSVCSVLSGLAKSFPMLLASRLLMGIAEGPFMPICVALLTVESTPKRRGLNIGIVQSLFASLLGAALAPYILVRLATWFSWRTAFFISGVPGILCALAILRWVREPKIAPIAGGGSEWHVRQRGNRVCPQGPQYPSVLPDRVLHGVVADAPSEFPHAVPHNRTRNHQGAGRRCDECNRHLRGDCRICWSRDIRPSGQKARNHRCVPCQPPHASFRLVFPWLPGNA